VRVAALASKAMAANQGSGRIGSSLLRATRGMQMSAFAACGR